MAEPAGDDAFAATQALFETVCDLAPRERARVLEERCAGNARMRHEVESLLARDERPDAAFERPPPGAQRLAHGLDERARPRVPERIGEYEIRRVLGVGGMGVVYEAEQRAPRRRVALKVLRSALMTEDQLRRFEHEAAVLGWLQHPGIATVYEAGTADVDGVPHPFLAMELVDGDSLDRFAADRGLDPPARLALVASIADAVHHAHQKGVVHRDLKPANVLVDDQGRPRVLDFGIARITASDLELTTRATSSGQLIGTLPYMSPEQVQGDPAAVDVRSDVYALGVLTYELLTGRRPLDVDSRPLPEAARAIVEQEPTALGLLDRRLRGDVEVIVSKAMAKEPERRYPSASAFAADLRRHLAHEPIHARPTSRLYQLRKFTRRNKAIVAGVATAFLAMAAGTAIAIWQAGVAHRAHMRADRERDAATIEAYRSTLAAAQSSLDAGDVAAAARLLEHVPPDGRGWEWRHLTSRFDRAAAVVEVPGTVASTLDAGGRLVVVSSAGTAPGGHAVRWFEPYLRRELRSVRLPPSDVRTAALSADGRRVATLSGPEGRRAALWGLDSDGPPTPLLDEQLADTGIDLALSIDGGTLAATSAGEARIWRAGESLRWSHGTTPRSITVSASGSHVGLVHFVDGVGVYRVFDVATGTGSADLGLDVIAVALSADGALAATSEVDGVVRLRKAATGRVLERFRSAPVPALVIAFDPRGLRLAGAGSDGATRIWALEGPLRPLANGGVRGHHVLAPEVVLPGRAPVRQVAFPPDHPGLLTVEGDAVNRLHDPTTDRAAVALAGHGHFVVDVAVSPDGSLVASGANDRTLCLRDGASGTCFAVLPYADDLTALAFSPDGTLGTGHRGEVRLLDPARPFDARRLALGGENVLALAFAPGGRRLGTLDAAGRTVVWSTDDGARLFEVSSAPLGEGDLAFSPSGRALATSAPGELVVLDAGTGARLETHRVDGARLDALAWLAPADVLASGWSDGAIRLFGTDAALPEASSSAAEAAVVMKSSNGAVRSLVGFPGGSRLAAGTSRGVVEIWDVATRRLTLELVRSGKVRALAVLPDGSRLFAATSSSTALHAWDSVPTSTRRSAAARLASLSDPLRARVLACFAESADPDDVAAALWRDPTLGERERRAALCLTVTPPPLDDGVARDPFDGWALAFEGADQHVVATGGDEALRMTDAFTIEAWIRPDAKADSPAWSRSGYQFVLNKEGEYQIAIGADGKLSWTVAGPDGWMPYWVGVRYPARPGRWTHVALVRDGTDIRFHVDGRRVQTFRGPERIGDHHPAMNELRIGGRQHTPQGFVGEIDEVRVWNVARTEAQILSTLRRSPPPDEPGLVSAWSFDEGAGAIANDATGRHPGRLAGAAWRATSR